MENFTKNSLKAAVAKYSGLAVPEAALREEITKDEKGYTAEQIDEIVSVIFKPDGAYDPEKTKEPEAADQPGWLQSILEMNAALIASNEAVIASNEAVIAGLEGFKKHSAKFVEDIISGSVQSSSEGNPAITIKTEKEVDLTATYIVAEGQSFRDSKDFSKVYKSGDSVSGMDEVRLKNLLNQGLIEEA